MYFHTLVSQLETLRIRRGAAVREADREQIRGLTEWVRVGLSHESFALDCMELELSAMASRRGPLDLAPFFVVPEWNVQMAFAYWAPGREIGAHQHRSWSVTGVFHNELEIISYDVEAAEAQRLLQKKRIYRAHRGLVGAIHEGGIHAPRNPTPRWSMSLHVSAPEPPPSWDARALRSPVVGLESGHPVEPQEAGPLGEFARQYQRQSIYRVHLDVLGRFGSARAERLVDAIYNRGDDETRRRAAMVLHRLGGELGRRRFREVCARELTEDTELSRRFRDLTLSVRSSRDRAELVAEHDGRRRLLLRVSAAAASALEMVARRSTFRLRELPGEIAAGERRSLGQNLLELGLFRPIVSGPLRVPARALEEA